MTQEVPTLAIQSLIKGNKFKFQSAFTPSKEFSPRHQGKKSNLQVVHIKQGIFANHSRKEMAHHLI